MREVRANDRRVKIAIATDAERSVIYHMRHDVYAAELDQHQENVDRQICDVLDDHNVYITAALDGQIAGFISITPPTSPSYSIDKYLARATLPFQFDDDLYELRILTVARQHRGSRIAAMLMYAAFRWVEAHGGTRIVAMGRRDVLSLYLKVGLKPLGRSIQSGAVSFELVSETVSTLRQHLHAFVATIRNMEHRIDWDLMLSFYQPAECFHGGAFFEAIGDDFRRLDTHETIINADVLDAWFAPAPKVQEVLQAHLAWLLRTSPPTRCEGMVRTIAQVRGVDVRCVLPGAGSSDLIFLALRQWLRPSARVLVLDPCYGEYIHLLENVIGCHVDRLTLARADGYMLDLRALEACFERDYDLIILVNPNNPTGRHIPRADLARVLRRAPPKTRIWLDETYIDYVGTDQSLEHVATHSENMIVCKSLSKVYALSGLRAGYLCAAPHLLEALRPVTPPWAVSLPAQVAAVFALQDPAYYARCYAQTHMLREQLIVELAALGNVEIVPGAANFVLFHLPADGPDAATVLRRARSRNLFLRDVAAMGSSMGSYAIRMAVKEAQINTRMIGILREALQA